MIRRLLAIVLALAATTLAPATTLGQKALVYCPVGVDASGCAQVANALRGSFPGGVDRGYDGSGGTVDLMKADLDHYAVIVVPSLADNVKTQPYAVLRAAAPRLRMAVNGQVAVYAGTPDLGNSARNEKDKLIQQLALWAASGKRFATGLVGLVAFQDLSEEAGSRFDWVKMISPVAVNADAEVQSFAAVQPLPGAPGALNGVGGYANMASFGLHIGAGSAARTIASAVGDGGSRPVVLVTYALANVGTASAAAGGASKMVAAGVYTSESGIAKSTDGSGSGPTLVTDKSDYIPGEIVTFSGAGWGAGDTVSIVLHEDPRWTDEDRVVTAIADGDGNFTNSTFVVDEHDFLVTFTATATGSPSGLSAQATFTDGVVKFQTSLTSPDSASFSWTLYGDATSDCTGTVTASGTQKVSGADVSLNFGGNNGYMRLTTTVPSGFSFQSWTIEGNSVPIVGGTTSTTVCFGVKNASRAKANFGGLLATTLSVATASGSYGGTVNVSATLTSGGSPLAGQTVSFTLNGASAGSATTNASGVASVTGANLGTIAPNTYATGVGASFAGATGYAGSTGSNSLTVSKASQTITFDAISNITYGDAAPTLSASASSGLAVSFATSSTACSVTAAGVVTINGAGTCEITASQAGNANYDAATSVSRSFTIGQAATIATAGKLTFAYDATAHPGSGTCSAGGVGSAGSYAPGGAAPTDAGHYTFTWSCPGDANHASAVDASGTIDISQVTSSVTVIAAGGVYTGSPIGAAASVSGTNLSEAISTITYTGRNTTTYGPSTTAPSDVGDYRASASYAGDVNHSSSSNYADYSITRAASVTVVTCTGSPVYTGSPITPCSVSVTGAGGLSLTPTPDYTDNVNAGTATASYSFAGDANHEPSSDSKTFVIAKAPSVTAVTCSGSPVYDGSAKEPCSVTVTGAGGLSLTPAPTYANNVNAGTATASYTFAGDANHTGSSDSKTFVIAKAPSSVMVLAAGGVYSGSPIGGTASVSGAGGLSQSLTVSYAGRNATTYGPSTTAPINAGDYTASAAFAGDANHESSSGSADFTITKAPVTPTADAVSATYDGAAHAGTGSCSAGDPGSAGSYAPGSGAPADAGDYTFVWSCPGDANHFGATANGTIHIEKATSTTTLTIAGGTFNGSAFAGTATATGAGGLSTAAAISYEGISGTMYGPSGSAPVHAGDYRATAAFAGDVNHTGSSDTKTFSIAKASSTTSISCPASVTYAGVALTPCSVSVTGAGGLSLTPTPSYSNNVNAGTATASYNFAGDADHLGSNDSKTFTIDKAAAVVSVSGYDVTYDNQAHTATGTATGVIGEDLSALLSLSGTSHLPIGTYTDSWSFAGNGNYESKSGTVTDRIRPDLVACGSTNGTTTCYSGQVAAWTPTSSSNSATLLLTSTLVDATSGSPGDIRTAKASFGLRSSAGTISPVSSAQGLAVGLVNAADLTVGTASASAQFSLSSNDLCQNYTIVVMVGGNYNKPTPPWEDTQVSVCRATPGSIISNPPAVIVPTGAGGVLVPTDNATSVVQFDVKYTKSGTNPQGKVKLTITSNRNRDGIVEPGSHHVYLITSNAISTLSVSGGVADFSAKANVLEEVQNGDGSVTMVQLDGGALIQLSLDQSKQSLAVTVNKSKSLGGNWFASSWDGKQAVRSVVANSADHPIVVTQ